MRLRLLSNARWHGFTLVEAMTAVTLVATAGTAMLFSVSTAMQASAASRGSSQANMLAKELMTEISACQWADPSEPSHWGPETDEMAKPTRASFDDLDDYDGWSDAPQTRDGATYDNLQQALFPAVRSHNYRDYTLSVSVLYVTATGKPTAVGKVSLYRQVTVEVTHPNHSPQELRRVFFDASRLLSRKHWFDPKLKEPVAEVTIVP
jgi:type II secretory pathway pseudopilin PulG